MMRRSFYTIALALSAFTMATISYGGIYVAPYASIRSTKSVDPSKKNKGTETEKIKQREEYGVNGGIGFFRIVKLNLSLGQSVLTTTEKTQNAVDEYGEIDYQSDLNMSTDDPTKEMKLKETQRIGRFSLIIDPSFWIIVMRAKIGVTATQRILEKEEVGIPKVSTTFGPTYKPHSGLGVGVRLTPRMFFMVEYSAYHYKFPEIEPFERQLAVNYALSI